MLKIVIFKLLIVLSLQAANLNWSAKDKSLYSNRHFTELSHLMIMQNKPNLRKKFELQAEDLNGCRSLHEGHGGVDAFLKCIKFLNREVEIGLFTPGRQKIVGDINILCKSLIKTSGSVNKIISASVFKGNEKFWGPCSTGVWEQVYLTVYANIDADPMSALAFARRAKEGLNGNPLWEARISKVVAPLAPNL